MRNNPMQLIMSMMQQGGNNPQVFVQNILQSNPEFAKQIQGQNPQSLAMQMLQQRGINPAQIEQMARGNKR